MIRSRSICVLLGLLLMLPLLASDTDFVNIPTVYAQSAASPISSGGGGGYCGDCLPPTLGVDNRGFQYVEDGFTINGNSFDVQHYYQTIPTQTFTLGEQIEVVLYIYENQGTDNLQHVELSLATYDQIISGILTEDSISTILWDKDNGVELYDNTSLLDNAEVTLEHVDDNITRATFSFQITHPLEPSTIKVKMWDSQLNGWNNYFEDAIQIVEKPSNRIKQTPLIQEKSEFNKTAPELTLNNPELLERLKALNSERRDALNLALENVEHAEYEKAIRIYEQLLQEYSNDADALNDLGRTYSLMQQDNKAIEHYEKAISIDPKNAVFRTNYAISLYNIGEYDRSLIETKKALELNSKNIIPLTYINTFLKANSDYEKVVSANTILLREIESIPHRQVEFSRNSEPSRWNNEKSKSKSIDASKYAEKSDSADFVAALNAGYDITKEKIIHGHVVEKTTYTNPNPTEPTPDPDKPPNPNTGGPSDNDEHKWWQKAWSFAQTNVIWIATILGLLLML